jgi:hypothetical protein
VAHRKLHAHDLLTVVAAEAAENLVGDGKWGLPHVMVSLVSGSVRHSALILANAASLFFVDAFFVDAFFVDAFFVDVFFDVFVAVFGFFFAALIARERWCSWSRTRQ